MRWLVLVKDYIRYRLTGELKMELSDAAGTLLLNVKQRQWSKTIMGKLNLPMESCLNWWDPVKLREQSILRQQN